MNQLESCSGARDPLSSKLRVINKNYASTFQEGRLSHYLGGKKSGSEGEYGMQLRT